MITLMDVRRVCLVNFKTDFRKSHDGLLGEAYKLGLKPYEGDMVVFIGRKKDRIKIIFTDINGIWMWYKKFHNGNLSKKFKFLNESSMKLISPSQVLDLLEGANYLKLGE